MSQFFNSGFAAAKRHALVLGAFVGAAAAAATGAYFKDLLTSGGTILSEKVAETACHYRQQPITNDSQFIILVSPLDEDPDGSHTKKVMRALIDEKGFNVVRICDPLNFNLSTASQTATDDVLKQASDLIKERHADLILFGYVSEQGKAIVIYAYNEHGGCDRHPKPTKIEQGVLSNDFTAEEKEKLIEVSLEEIQKACLNQASIDWKRFGKRMDKMEMFFKYFDFSQPKALYFAGSYVEAMRLLYGNGQGDGWFSKGNEFAKHEMDKEHAKDQETSEALSYLYTEYAILLRVKSGKTNDKNDRDAFGAFDKAIGLDPENAYAYRVRGGAYASKSDWNRAIEDYTKAIDLGPKDARGYASRGEAYGEKGEWDRAIDDFTKAIGLDPNPGRYGVRGDAYRNKGDPDRAIQDYTKAIELDPKVAAGYTGRGEAYGAKRDWNRAIADYDKAIELDPKSTICACAYKGRGSAYLAKGDTNRAIEDYTKAIDFDPKDAQAYGGRGDAYIAKRDFDHAIEDYTKAIGLDPKDAHAYGGRGYAYGQKSEWDRAIADYTKAIQLDPKSANLWNGRCVARAIAGRLEQALPDCNRSLDLEPNNADVRDSRAFVYLKMGKRDEAIADYNIALGLNPSLAASLYGRGVAKLKKGDTDSGNSDIESAKRIQPDIADEFQRYGIQLTQLSQSPPHSRTSHHHQSHR